MPTKPPALTLPDWQLLRLVLDDHITSEIESQSQSGAKRASKVLAKLDARITHMQAAAAARTTPKGNTP